MLRRKKKRSRLASVGRYAVGASALGAGSFGVARLIRNRNLSKATASIKKPSSAKNSSNLVTSRTANPLSKKAQNSLKVKKRLEALGGTASVLKNKTARTPGELNNLRSLKAKIGRRNALKATKLRSQGRYFTSRQNNILNFMNYRNGNMAQFSVEDLDTMLDETLDEIESQYEQGLLTEDEADELEENAHLEYDEYLEEIDEDEFDEDEDEEDEFSAYDGELANFSAGTPVGNVLLEHIVAADPQDPETTIAELAWSLGLVDQEGYELDEEEAIAGVLGVISGEIDADESIVEGIADYLDLNDDEVDEIYEVAGEDLDDEEYDDEDEYEEEGYDDEYVDELESEIDGLESELTEVGTVAEEAFSRIENMEAQFASAMEQQATGRAFDRLERDAYSLVESGQMPPAIFEEHYGNFESQEQQLAAFSQVCDNRGVTPEAELYRLESLNDTYAGMEANISFSQFSYADNGTEDYEEDDAIAAQALRNYQARVNSGGFGEPMNLEGLGLPRPQKQQVQQHPSTNLTSVAPPMTATLATTPAQNFATATGDRFRSF